MSWVWEFAFAFAFDLRKAGRQAVMDIGMDVLLGVR